MTDLQLIALGVMLGLGLASVFIIAIVYNDRKQRQADEPKPYIFRPD